MSIVSHTSRSKGAKASLQAKSFCEFFAGMGLVRAGLEASGWKCVYANDIDPKKEELYSARFGGEHFHLEDVHNTKSIVATLDCRPVLATASFPCIDLSLAGHGRGLKGDHSSTFFGFTNAIAQLGNDCPRIVMVENVNGLLTSHEGNDFRSIANTLAELGYFLDCFVLDARDFVPQSRPRVFIVGVHESVIDRVPIKRSNGEVFDPWFTEISRSRVIRPKRLVGLFESTRLSTGWIATPIELPESAAPHLREYIDNDASQDWWETDQVTKHYEMMSDLHRELVDRLLKERESVHVGTIYRRKRYGKTRAEVRFDGIAGCLRVPRGGSARQIVIVVDRGELKIRWMSPREYARLQGAAEFPLVGRPGQQMAGFGDAVCVPVIEWIDAKVLTPLYDSIASNTEAGVCQ